MLFRYKCGTVKEITRNDFINNKEYYEKKLEIKIILLACIL